MLEGFKYFHDPESCVVGDVSLVGSHMDLNGATPVKVSHLAWRRETGAPPDEQAPGGNRNDKKPLPCGLTIREEEI